MTISYYLRRSDTGADGRAPLYLRISHQGTQKFVSLDLKVLASKWNPDRQKLKRSHPDANRLNAYLDRILSTARTIASRMKTNGELVTAGRVRERVAQEIRENEEAEEDDDFLAFCRRELEGYRRRGQRGTHKSYRSILEKFEQFFEREFRRDDLPFSALDARLFRRFRTFCYEVRGNNPNTVGKALKVMRTFVRSAMKEGHVPKTEYPFDDVEIDSAPTEKEKLTPDEIEAIAALELDRASTIAEVRRWFLFAYESGGMRFSDVATLQHKHVRSDGGRKRVKYRMEKTDDVAGVPLTERARRILSFYEGRSDGRNDWVFPIMDGIDPDEVEAIHQRKESRNAMANKYLQKMAKQAGIDRRISFHMSRNAALWKLYKRLGDIYKVSKIAGHASVEQTETYLEGFKDDSLDDDFLSAME